MESKKTDKRDEVGRVFLASFFMRMKRKLLILANRKADETDEIANKCGVVTGNYLRSRRQVN